MPRSTARVIFRGKVQGVFFRANTRKFADFLGVKGWVRNLPDGTVEAVFSGRRQLIEEVIARCVHEQPYARVSGHVVEWLDDGELISGDEAVPDDFEIRY